MPSRSDVLRARVVTDTEKKNGCSRCSAATTVDLPTPDGPETTIRRPLNSVEGVEECCSLAVPQAAQATALCDSEALHQPLRLHLAGSGK